MDSDDDSDYDYDRVVPTKVRLALPKDEAGPSSNLDSDTEPAPKRTKPAFSKPVPKPTLEAAKEEAKEKKTKTATLQLHPCKPIPKFKLGKDATTGTVINEDILKQIPRYTPYHLLAYSVVAGLRATFERGLPQAFADSQEMVELLGASNAGDLIESVVRQWRQCEDVQVRDAVGSKRKNGTNNGQNSTENDWREGKNGEIRVECKSASLSYAAYWKRWKLMFANIKKGKYDKLYLAFATPNGIEVFDGTKQNVGTSGVKTNKEGGEIQWSGPNGVTSPRKALKRILKTYEHLCVATLAYSDFKELLSVRTPGHYALKGTPLADINRQMRGHVVEGIVQHFAPTLFNGAVLTRLKDPGLDCNGDMRNSSQSTADFLLGGKRPIEIKTGTLTWHTTHGCWAVVFKDIKRELHDHLILVFHAPNGLHVIEHVGDFMWCNTSKVVQVYAPFGTLAGETVKPDKRLTNPKTIAANAKRSFENGTPAVAAEKILKKFWLGGCPYIAHIAF